MIYSDYHMHSYFSGDCKTPTEEMILASIQKGLKNICFTEHNDPDYVYVFSHETGMFDLDIDSYQNELFVLKNKYSEKIQIGFGLELGIQPHIHEKCSKCASSHPFDFIIASSHVCKRKDPYYPSYYDGISIKEGIRDYFEEILTNVSSYTDYDVYGHLDYIVRYIPDDRMDEYKYRFDDYKDIFEAIYKKIIESGKGIEINSSGLFQKNRETNPCPEAVRFYRELGGEIITVGADAHKTERIAAGFEDIEEILIKSGFQHYCTFKDRKAVFHDL